MTTELQRVTRKVIKVEPPKAGFYRLHFDDGTSDLKPRVTNVLSVIDKPALKYWAADIERVASIDAALGASGANEALDRLEKRFGKTKAGRIKHAHEVALSSAGDIGTSLHAAIQQYLKGEENDTLDGPALLAFMAWEDWAKSVALEPLHVETMVGSETMGAGGTLDCAGYANVPGLGAKPQVVFDWKSSKRSKSAPNGIYFEAKVQVAVYRAIAIEMEMISEDAWGAVVRLPKSENDPVLTEKEPFDVAWLDPEECDRLAKGFLSILDTWTFVKVGA